MDGWLTFDTVTVVVLILAGFAAVVAGALGCAWVALLRHAKRRGDGAAAFVYGLLAVSVVSAVLLLPKFGALGAAVLFVTGLAPIVFGLNVPTGLWSVLGPVPLAAALPVGLLFAWPRALRHVSVVASVLAGLAASFVWAEIASQRAMCRAAAAHGIDTFQRRSFLDSWAAWNARPNWDLHAGWTAEDRRYVWSYGRFDFFLDEEPWFGDLPTETHACG